jgi:hypothetical protein
MSDFLCFCIIGTAVFCLFSQQTSAFSMLSQKQQQQQSFLLSHAGTSAGRYIGLKMVDEEKNIEDTPLDDDESSVQASSSSNTKSGQYDVSKLVAGQGDEEGSGFNQFDPVLSATGFLSRRFGIIGGLTIFAGLAFVEGREIIKGLDDATPLQGNGETITTASGLKITDILIGKSGSVPLPGYIIGLKLTVKIGDSVIYQTAAGEKPVAFKYGQRPFQNVICEGVEEGIKGMKVGGKRVLEIPANLAPAGVNLPPGVPLTYDIELNECLSGYF